MIKKWSLFRDALPLIVINMMSTYTRRDQKLKVVGLLWFMPYISLRVRIRQCQCGRLIWVDWRQRVGLGPFLADVFLTIFGEFR
jgi:hypothetical protein